MAGAMVVGNWKMHRAPSAARELARDIVQAVGPEPSATVVLCPPFVSLHAVAEVVGGSPISLGAQNVHWEDEGAFTGEISGPMLMELGCRYVIIGHSERRQLFGETDEGVRMRTGAALRAGLRPIVCVGETAEQRDQGITDRVVCGQLAAAIRGLAPADLGLLAVAYEPVWAIGTGRAADPALAQAVHARLAQAVVDAGAPVGTVSVLYGGSVNADNAGAYFAQPDISGALVGGASLKAAAFAAIAAAC